MEHEATINEILSKIEAIVVEERFASVLQGFNTKFFPLFLSKESLMFFFKVQLEETAQKNDPVNNLEKLKEFYTNSDKEHITLLLLTTIVIHIQQQIKTQWGFLAKKVSEQK